MCLELLPFYNNIGMMPGFWAVDQERDLHTWGRQMRSEHLLGRAWIDLWSPCVLGCLEERGRAEGLSSQCPSLPLGFQDGVGEGVGKECSPVLLLAC